MATEISWVRSLFSESYTFSARNMSIGEMKIAMLSGKGEGSLLGQKVRFKSKGVLSPKVELYDDATGNIIVIRPDCLPSCSPFRRWLIGCFSKLIATKPGSLALS
jgi:hypothetical protein